MPSSFDLQIPSSIRRDGNRAFILWLIGGLSLLLVIAIIWTSYESIETNSVPSLFAWNGIWVLLFGIAVCSWNIWFVRRAFVSGIVRMKMDDVGLHFTHPQGFVKSLSWKSKLRGMEFQDMRNYPEDWNVPKEIRLRFYGMFNGAFPKMIVDPEAYQKIGEEAKKHGLMLDRQTKWGRAGKLGILNYLQFKETQSDKTDR